MQISWFEIIAQIINFFIILFILQKLLYKPVINIMEERQEKIQKSQIEADEKMEEAKELISQYDGKIADIDTEKREILSNARQEAKAKKNSLLEDYKAEAEAKRKAYLKEIEDEKAKFLSDLRKSLGKGAVKIASHILNIVSSKEIENEVFNSFIKTLEGLDENIPDPKVLKEEKHLTVQSSRKLSTKEKSAIENTIKKQIKELEDISYQVDDSLILGHELDLETYTVHTNIKNYLNKIEQDIIKNLETN
ncbi:MAG: F0F1 ATP synthase subunit B family protein [Tissierella sp.]|uniref:F0F1 ATP synthase subunit B family protein n=1 Tax=Tissierella sp. TaxID=41274 RepID=UPI003F98CFD5